MFTFNTFDIECLMKSSNWKIYPFNEDSVRVMVGFLYFTLIIRLLDGHQIEERVYAFFYWIFAIFICAS